MEFAINLWNKNKWLFFLAIPLVLLFVFKDVIMSLIISSAKEKVKDAEKQDSQLAKDQESLNDQANLAKQQADDIEANRKARSEENIDVDWYKKVKNAKKQVKKVSSKKVRMVKTKRKASKKVSKRR